jgi:hypothetical protein
VARLARDLRRHFPQQAECVEGLVAGSGLPRAFFLAQLAAAFGRRPVAGGGGAVALGATGGGEPPGLARSLEGPLLLRRSRPEGGFAAIEVARPWLGPALAGVNAGGLAATAVALADPAGDAACAVPAALLVQDCLARFDSVSGAVDWCLGRPAGGCARILLADATGAVAAVDCDGGSRRRHPAGSGPLVAGDVDPAAVRAAAPLSPPDAAKLLGPRVAVLDPAGRRLAILDAGAAPSRWLPAPSGEGLAPGGGASP